MFGLLAVFMLVASFVVPANMATPEAVEAGADSTLRWAMVDTPNAMPNVLKEVWNGPDMGVDGIPDGAELNRFVIASNGATIYMIATSYGAFGGVPTLYKSTNWGISWSVAITKNMALSALANYPLWDVAVAPDDPNIVAVVACDAAGFGPQEVWVSTDGGVKWDTTQLNLGGTAEYISCIDISMDYGGTRDLLVGTRTGTGAGRVFVLNVPGFATWNAQTAAGVPASTNWPAVADVVAGKFSPTYVGDSAIVVVYADATSTNIITGIHDLDVNSTVWGALPTEVRDPVRPAGASPGFGQIVTADLELPADYSGQAASLRRAYVSIDSNDAFCSDLEAMLADEGIYRIDDNVQYELMDTTTVANKRISSIAYYGTYASGKLLAGEVLGFPCTATVPTWFTDSPTTCPIPCWYPALKPTTGAANQGLCQVGVQDGMGNAQVAWNPDGSLAVAITGSACLGFFNVAMGTPGCVGACPWGEWPDGYMNKVFKDESAFAISRNNGETWNQLSAIDTEITKLTDIVPSADCSTVYLASVNDNDTDWPGGYCCVTANITFDGTECDDGVILTEDCTDPFDVMTVDALNSTIAVVQDDVNCECDYTLTLSVDINCDCADCQPAEQTVTKVCTGSVPWELGVPSSAVVSCCETWTCDMAGCEGETMCAGFDSVWRSSSNPTVASPLPGMAVGTIWERVLCHVTAETCEEAQSQHAILRLAPDKEDGEIVFWAAGGTSGLAAMGDCADCQINCDKVLLDVGANTQAVMWSPDFGDYWANINPRLAVQDMVAESSTVLYILSLDGLVQRMPYTGTAWSSAVSNGDTLLSAAHTIDAFAEGHVLVGAAADAMGAGFVASYSGDAAATWGPSAGKLTQANTGNRHVAFDTNFADTSQFYLGDDGCAANAAANNGGVIWLNSIPFGAFEDMLTNPWGVPYHRLGYYGLAVPHTGDALYGAHCCTPGVCLEEPCEQGGELWVPGVACAVERTIYRYWPIAKPGIPWDCLNVGTDDFAGIAPCFTLEPSSLKLCGCLTMDTDTVLYAIDNDLYSCPIWTGSAVVGQQDRDDGMLWVFTDCLAKAGPELITEDELLVGCDPVSGRNQEINLQWEQLCLATGYDIEIAKDSGFTTNVIDWLSEFDPLILSVPFIPANPLAPACYFPAGADTGAWAGSAIALGGNLECGHTYYWRVKVRMDARTGLVRSAWSEARSFTIKAGLPVRADYYGIKLLAPDNGCLGCPVSPASFSWAPFKGTTSYKFVLAKDAALTDVIAEAEVGTTAYEYDGTLDYSTNYFWRVMSLEPAPSDWSATFSFQTEAAPEAPPAAPEAPTTPLWVWVVIAIGAILVIVTLVLIFKTRRV